MNELAICLTVDSGYMFAGFASAVWLRERAGTDAAVVILAFDMDRAAHAALAAACDAAGVTLLALSRAHIDGAPAMLARLFLAKLLPSDISRILYMDADTQYPGPLGALLRFQPEPGFFLAARDPMAFMAAGFDQNAADATAHFQAIGLSDAEGASYVNSGVILAERESWAAIGHDVLRLFAKRGAATPFPDQDLLNIAARGRHLPLSLAWNFPAYLLRTRLARTVRPRIVHYMGNPKPWQGAYPPWACGTHSAYAVITSRFPMMATYRPRVAMTRRLGRHAWQRVKLVRDALTWGFGPRHASVVAYERDALVRPGSPSEDEDEE